jgi:hypothetical protein
MTQVLRGAQKTFTRDEVPKGFVVVRREEGDRAKDQSASFAFICG